MWKYVYCNARANARASAFFSYHYPYYVLSCSSSFYVVDSLSLSLCLFPLLLLLVSSLFVIPCVSLLFLLILFLHTFFVLLFLFFSFLLCSFVCFFFVCLAWMDYVQAARKHAMFFLSDLHQKML